MKHANTIALILTAAGLALPAAAVVSIPQSPVVTYGLIRDEYGTPMTSAQACALELVKDDDRDGRVYATGAVGDSSVPGMNYRLTLEIDSAAGGRKNAVTKGTRMFIRAAQDGSGVTLAPAATFVTPAQGTRQRLDFTTGEDADGDGLPDAWEALVLDMAGEDSSDAGLRAFRPEDDADGDGMSNLKEYLAGTDPFLETDILKITAFERVPGTTRAKVTFTTSLDHRSRLVMAESLANPVWSPVAVSDTVDGTLGYRTIVGDGYERTLYIDTRLSAAFIRLAAD